MSAVHPVHPGNPVRAAHGRSASRWSRWRALLPIVLAIAVLGASVTPPPGNVIRVKGVAGDTVVSLVPSDGGGLLRLDLMARLLGGDLADSGGGRWRLTLYGTALDLHVGVPFAAYNGFVLPLHEAVQSVGGAPHAPLQLFSEIVPRFGIGILWDRSRWELRLFQGIARGQATQREGILRDVPQTPVATVANSSSAPPPTRSAPTPAVSSAAAASKSTGPAPTPAATSSAAAAKPAGPPPTPGMSRRYTVAIDAGHGGRDPGNLGVVIGNQRVTEAMLTLPIALKLELELKNRGVDVVMTRKRDTLVARDDRGPIANASKADLFMSLHTNAANPAWKNGSAVRGFETYFLSTARTEDERRVANMENDVVRFETETPAEKGDPLSLILLDMAQNEHLRESSDLAQVVQDQLAKYHPGPNRGVKQAGFAVLARSYMPAVLVEIGFGTNLQDARWMASAEGQRSIATALADAVLEYLAHYERRTRGAVR
jgi:N-acetylmuramoyl-L-alanine amidase